MAKRQLAAIMFTDIAGYTAMMGTDEEGALDTLRKSREIQKTAIEKNNGKWLKEMGDGVLAQFNSAFDAVSCALAIQKRAHTELTAKIRIGIHLGDITLENNDVFGDGVNIASRLQALADPGGIYVSESIHQAIHANPAIHTKYLADVRLKNVSRPVRTYCLVEEWLPAPQVSKIKKIDTSSVKRKLILPITTLIVIIAALIGWYMKSQANASMTSVAVLPITNISGDSTNNILMAGLHSELRDQIASIRSLRVPSRTSTSKYINNNKSIPEIALELGVDVILEPDIYEIGDSIKINVRLIKAFPEEHQLWSYSYNRAMGNVVSIYVDIAKAIAQEMNIDLGSDLVASLPKEQVNTDAYKTYIEGLGYLYQATPGSIDQALNYFNRSAEIDSNYAPAYVGLAMVWGFRMQMGIVSTLDAAPHVKKATSKALSLGSDNPEIHFLLATTNTWGYWNWDEADKEFKTTLEMDPTNAEARAYYAHYLNIMQRGEEATIQMDKALQLESNNWLVQALYGMYLNHTRLYDKALTRLKNTLKNDPGNLIALAALWTIYHNTGKYDEALETAKILYTEKREYRAVEILITGNQQGGYENAMEGVAEVFIAKMDTTFVTPWQIATLYTRADNREKAVDWLEKAYDAHDANMPYISCDPIFDKIADLPRFQTILSKMNLKRTVK